jgi:pseudaminic acid cytidylyltransferase
METEGKSRICIIPARGGSKRIPRKNIKDFFGRPVITYAISTALDTGLFDKVFVSTDDQEIAQISKSAGADVDFLRSSHAASDTATTMQVITEVIESFERLGEKFDEILCLYPITPLVTSDMLICGQHELKESVRSLVFPVLEYGHPIWRALHSSDDGKMKRIWPEHTRSRTQDLPKAFHDAGQWYWMHRKNVCPEMNFDSFDLRPIPLQEIDAQDVDNESDWSMLELKYKQRFLKA